MSAALERAARRLPGRSAAAKVVCVAAYLALAWLFGGPVGLAIGIAVVIARWTFGFATGWLWIGAIGALAAACAATFVRGLPTSSVVGPGFGEHHIAAHVLVGTSLALAAFAGLLEADRTRWRPPRRRRLAAARAGRRGRGVAVATAAGGPLFDAGQDRPSREEVAGAAPGRPREPDTPSGGAGPSLDLRPPDPTPPATARRPRSRAPRATGRPARGSPAPPRDGGTGQPPRP